MLFIYSRKNQIIILALICFCVFFAHLNVLDADLMEARNFVTAREITENNSWLIPTMNGELRIAKPPLPTWLAALAMQLGDDDNLLILRLPSAMSASLLVFFLFGLSSGLSRQPLFPFLSSCILATSYLVIDVGRTGSWDIFCHSFMLGGLLFFWRGLESKEAGWSSFIWAGIFLGLSFLSKGPVAFYVMLLPFFLSYAYIFGLKNLKAKWRGMVSAVFICIMISIFWPLYIYLNHPDLLIAVTELETDSWVNRHVRLFWYYWKFPVYAGVWLVFTFQALISIPENEEGRRNTKFYFAWWVVTFILLSIIPEKKARYFLPALIPLSLLTGDLVSRMIDRYKLKKEKRIDEWIVRVHTVLFGTLSPSLPIVVYYWLSSRKEIDSQAIIILLFTVFGTITFLLWRYFRHRNILKIFLTSVGLVCVFNLLILSFARNFVYVNPEYKTLPNVRNLPKLQNMNYYCIGNIDIKCVWDLGRKIKKWDPETDTGPMLDLPIAVISDDYLEHLFSGEFREKSNFSLLGVYDYNKSKPGKKTFLTIIETKQN